MSGCGGYVFGEAVVAPLAQAFIEGHREVKYAEHRGIA